MIFNQPAKKDVDYALSMLMHDARRQAADQKNRIKSDAAKQGALNGNRVIIVIADEVDKIHAASLVQAKKILIDFIKRMQKPAADITGWARPHLDNLNNTVLAEIPVNGFPGDHQRVVTQYQAVFQQRVDGGLCEVEIGYAKDTGFSGDTPMPEKEWITAKATLTMLGTWQNGNRMKTICERAHAGLIKARARRFIRDRQVHDNVDIPIEFWWAEGEAALSQNWETGDFETWINQNVHIQAFGVTFLRSDIEQLMPASLAVTTALTEAKSGESEGTKHSPASSEAMALPVAVVLTAIEAETQAVLRHLTDRRRQRVFDTWFQTGRFDRWEIAVAEVGPGNASAATIATRALAHFNPEIAAFVGVAGGIKDVTLGDVVVATKVYGYKSGKETPDGFLSRPDVQKSHHELEQRARVLRSDAMWHGM